MQIDFTDDELAYLFKLVSLEAPINLDIYDKMSRLSLPRTKTTGHFSWRMPDGGRQVNCAVVLVDGKIIDDVAVADTDAGLVATFGGEMIEGRVEVWVP